MNDTTTKRLTPKQREWLDDIASRDGSYVAPENGNAMRTISSLWHAGLVRPTGGGWWVATDAGAAAAGRAALTEQEAQQMNRTRGTVECSHCGGSAFANGTGSVCDECEPAWAALAEERCEDCGARFKIEPHEQDCDWWMPSAALTEG